MKMKLLVFLNLIFVFFTITMSQNNNLTILPSNDVITWAKAYVEFMPSSSSSIIETSDGGFMVMGYTLNPYNGEFNILLIKLNKNGKIIWDKMYGGKNYSTHGTSIVETPDEEFLMAGKILLSDQSQFKILLAKLDFNGNILWAKTYDENGIGETIRLVNVSDGGYILLGFTNSNITGNSKVLVIKLNSSGEEIWAKAYEIPDNNYYISTVVETLDSGFLVVGGIYSQDAEGYKPFVFKIDSNGNISWGKTYSCPENFQLSSAVEAGDGGTIISGTVVLENQLPDGVVIKLTSTGKVKWAKAIGGSSYDGLNSITKTSDGKFVSSGYTRSFGAGNTDLFLMKFDENANIIWNKRFGEFRTNEVSNCIVETSDGGLISAGSIRDFSSSSNFLVVKTDSEGNIEDCSYMVDCSPDITPLNLEENFKIPIANNSELNISNFSLPSEDLFLSVKKICVKKGDINDDGVVDMRDIVYFANYFTENHNEMPDDTSNWDMNEDGKITLSDLILLIIKVEG